MANDLKVKALGYVVAKKAKALREKHPGRRISANIGQMTGVDVLAHEMADVLEDIARALKILGGEGGEE